MDLLTLADSYQELANDTPGLAGHAAQNAADKIRTAAAAAREADQLLRDVANGDGDEPRDLALVA